MSNHYFFLKVSLADFKIDTTQYTSKVLLEKEKILLLAGYEDYVSFNEENDVLTVQAGSKKLKNAEIKWNPKTFQLDINLDRFGLKSIFYKVTDDSIFVTDSSYLMEKIHHDKTIHREAVLFYCLAGFLPARWSFLTSYEQVDRTVSINLKTKKISKVQAEWQNHFLKSNDLSFEEVTDCLTQTLDLFKKEIRPAEMRLSGGVDTRVVSYLWKDRINCSVVHSPWVEPGQDLDVNLSRAWAKKMGFEHRVLYRDQAGFSFFCEESSRPILTGLCGGEFLGGQFVREMPSHPQSWIKSFQNAGFAELNMFFENDWVKECLKSEEFWLTACVRTFLQSIRTTIYKSVEGSWMSPANLSNTVISPFTEPYFVEKFLKMPISRLRDYSFYKDYFLSLGKELRSLPLSSQILCQIPELTAPPEWGVEPKAARALMPKSTAPAANQPPDAVYDFLRENHIITSRELFKWLTSRPETLLNIRSLEAWLKQKNLI